MGACREPEEPHQLHFDMREAALRQGLDKYRLDHPVSLLIFLLQLPLPLCFASLPENSAQHSCQAPFVAAEQQKPTLRQGRPHCKSIAAADTGSLAHAVATVLLSCYAYAVLMSQAYCGSLLVGVQCMSLIVCSFASLTQRICWLTKGCQLSLIFLLCARLDFVHSPAAEDQSGTDIPDIPCNHITHHIPMSL